MSKAMCAWGQYSINRGDILLCLRLCVLGPSNYIVLNRGDILLCLRLCVRGASTYLIEGTSSYV